VEPGNSIDLAEAVIDLLEDPARAARTAVQGYERYLRSYTPEIFAERIMKLYSGIAVSSNC
jgi:glycosyltransferase involved in cell wall biosynthesis